MSATEIPAIDLAPFLAGSADGKRSVAEAVGRACREIGFLTIVGHGVPDRLVSDMQAAAKRFFDLPMAEKMRIERQAPAFNRGYGPLAQEGLAKSLGEYTPNDYKETLSFGPPDVPDEPYYRAEDAFPHFAENRFPERPAELRPLVIAYYRELQRLAADIMRIFAVALDLPEEAFAPAIDRQCGGFRLINYPEQHPAPVVGQLRAGAHSDYGSLTILKTEDAPGGLQVRMPDGRWADVQAPPGGFVVNIGDLMARWTNDRWVSTLHRVVNPPPDRNLGSRRLSLVFFHQPNYDAVIECITKDGEQPKYPPVTSGRHRLAKLYRTNDYAPAAAE